MRNAEIAKVLRETATLLELKEDNYFRIRAYYKAADNIESATEDVETLSQEKRLTDIAGIGKDLASKIEGIINTNTFSLYEQLKKEIPQGLLEMLDIPGLGPETVKLIYEKLKIDTVDKLFEAAKEGRLRGLEGIKQKSEENILRGIELFRQGRERSTLSHALSVSEEFLSELKALKEVKKIECAGSLRRRRGTVKDIDILVVSTQPEKVMRKFAKIIGVNQVLSQGKTKSSVLAGERNIEVDLRVIEAESFGSALIYFTGSKQFNIKLRQLAHNLGYKINEYGVFKGSLKLAGRTEEEIFKLMNMQPIPPELREDRGEIEESLANSLPCLLKAGAIKGEFHVHSDYSDGMANISQIAQAGLNLGYSYIAISDHSQSLKIANGVSIEDMFRKVEEIKAMNAKSKKITILCGAEVDILSEGTLDYPDDVLKQCDLVIASIHSGFRQTKKELTRRIIRACKNKYVNIIGHPTGYLRGVREAYDIDLDEILKAARDYRVALEINCHPSRLDLNDVNCLRAKKAQVKLALGTDAHLLEQLPIMDLGVSLARRGWLEEKDLLNCMNLKDLTKWLKKY